MTKIVSGRFVVDFYTDVSVVQIEKFAVRITFFPVNIMELIFCLIFIESKSW